MSGPSAGKKFARVVISYENSLLKFCLWTLGIFFQIAPLAHAEKPPRGQGAILGIALVPWATSCPGIAPGFLDSKQSQD
jgi:hypothetical protein